MTRHFQAVAAADGCRRRSVLARDWGLKIPFTTGWYKQLLSSYIHMCAESTNSKAIGGKCCALNADGSGGVDTNKGGGERCGYCFSGKCTEDGNRMLFLLENYMGNYSHGHPREIFF
jgi:hypothetical protein